jgi:hypothetical protein
LGTIFHLNELSAPTTTTTATATNAFTASAPTASASFTAFDAATSFPAHVLHSTAFTPTTFTPVTLAASANATAFAATESTFATTAAPALTSTNDASNDSSVLIKCTAITTGLATALANKWKQVFTAEGKLAKFDAATLFRK